MRKFLLSMTKILWALLCIGLSNLYARHHLREAWLAGHIGGALAVGGVVVIALALGELDRKGQQTMKTIRTLVILLCGVLLGTLISHSTLAQSWQVVADKWEYAATLWEARTLECQGLVHPPTCKSKRCLQAWREFNEANPYAGLLIRRDEALRDLHKN